MESQNWYSWKLITGLEELIFGFFQKRVQKNGQGEEKVLEKVKIHRD